MEFENTDSETEQEFMSDFWNDFTAEKTLKNALQHLYDNYSHIEKIHKEKFLLIVKKDIIGKDVSNRKLAELLDTEFKKPYLKKVEKVDENNSFEKNIDELNIHQADMLDGNEFQNFVAKILEKNEYTDVQVTGQSGDQGGDIVARKGEQKIVIQVKRYSLDRRVTNTAVQEVFAAKAHYDADIGAVITNSFYTNGAKELARETDVILWNRQDVIKFIQKYNEINDEDEEIA